jgi:hypothetical protein
MTMEGEPIAHRRDHVLRKDGRTVEVKRAPQHSPSDALLDNPDAYQDGTHEQP